MFWVVLAFVGLSLAVIVYVLYHRFGLENSETIASEKGQATPSVERVTAPDEAEVPEEIEALYQDVVAQTDRAESSQPVAVTEQPLKEVIVTLPEGVSHYPRFTHARAIEELELSEEEAIMFIGELAQQIDAELPGLEKEVAKENTDKVELIVHMLKGAAISLGKGGISDVLVDFNNYCRNGNDIETIHTHLNNFKYYFDQFKEEYGL